MWRIPAIEYTEVQRPKGCDIQGFCKARWCEKSTNREKRNTSEIERIKQQEYQRLKKQKYRARVKARKEATQISATQISAPLTTPQKLKQKVLIQRLRRKLSKRCDSKEETPSNSNEDPQERVEQAEVVTGRTDLTPLTVSTSLWNCLSPSSKKETRQKLRNHSSESKETKETKETDLQWEIREFFDNRDKREYDV